MNRTNGPWHLVGNSVYSASGTCITETQWGEVGHVEYPHKAAEATANAAFIVEACNAYDTIRAQNAELVKALSHLLVRASSLDQSATHDGLQNCDALAKARAALAKVQKEVGP